MESKKRPSDPVAARAALDDIDTAARSVRDMPWPTWIYFFNAALFAAMCLTRLLGERSFTYFAAAALAICAVNVWAARRMGIRSAMPSSTGFLVSVIVVGACLFASMFIPAGYPDAESYRWIVVALAFAAAASYLLGSLMHYRSTHR